MNLQNKKEENKMSLKSTLLTTAAAAALVTITGSVILSNNNVGNKVTNINNQIQQQAKNNAHNQKTTSSSSTAPSVSLPDQAQNVIPPEQYLPTLNTYNAQMMSLVQNDVASGNSLTYIKDINTWHDGIVSGMQQYGFTNQDFAGDPAFNYLIKQYQTSH